MKILFIADGRSPTTRSWLRYWIETGHSVHLISTFPCDIPPGLFSFHVLPVAFGTMAGNQMRNYSGVENGSGKLDSLRGFLRHLRYYLGPLSLPIYQVRYRSLVAEIQPELVHALRIPFEGMLSVVTPHGIPLVISTWGNDITLHARGSFFMASLTRGVLNRADGLITDTQRDIQLGIKWGFKSGQPTLIVPGSGGIRLDEIGINPVNDELPEELPNEPVIVNPRGQRPGSLRQDVFFQAIPEVLIKVPKAVFVCPSMRGDKESELQVDKLGIRSNTKLWPRLSQAQLWRLFQKSQIFVSPSIHDGTPNSMLETMACGCFPIVGDIESMHEWVQPGINGLLVDATDAHSIADAILQAINKPVLRIKAAKYNAVLIAERAAYLPNMARVERFYKEVRSNI
ncbi:MAG: glycosyltransferase family 4 protein [Anaerolineales bacterium]|jgi:glycosyltransferase involved in cell wall biosynthesis